MRGRRWWLGLVLASTAWLGVREYAAAQGVSRGQVATATTDEKTPSGPSRTNEDLQPATLPPLPAGVTTEQLVEGDRIFHSVGGCFACHGAEGEGLPAAGAPITTGLAFVPTNITAIAALIAQGLPDADTRSPIAMPPRGARGTLTPTEITLVATYVWAISQARGEPWPGGHRSHFHLIPPGSTAGTASPDRPAPRHQ